MDWTSYPTKSECSKGSDGKHPKSKKMICKLGYTGKEKAYWRYPSKYLAKGFKAGVSPTASGEEKEHLKNMRIKAHTATATKKRKEASAKRKKAGLPVFSGYSSGGDSKKSSSTANI